ncbi:hypothetical protein LUZ63_009944 [Rhynchospora breviuscula]|uniref:PGG domain-containing protein n=1 Tax=Rhynchospora breviuscula TaxID=2022672 RepID=A0A9Q0CG06_9POAL|nr:hypothetical protein LUZ63_009944 [Rhynchospora breviuscula]
MSVDLLANALSKARDLEDDNLCAALQLAEGDERWNALLCPPLDPARCGTNVQLFDERHVMCPDLYQATQSGSINRVNELLGFTDETTRKYEASNDVKVVLGAKFHGDGFCTLREVTAGKNTMLHIAAGKGHVELAEQLIQKDHTLLTSENSRHETPLHLAARAGNHRIISLIVLLAQQSLTHGAFEVLSKRSTNGDTVLHEAVRNGHEEAVQVLMTVAPALSAKVNTASISPLYLAVVRKSVGVVKALLEYKQASVAGPNKQNALHAAVLGSPELTSMLLQWRAELAYERDASGSTPLHYAASDGDVAVVQTILDKAPLAVYIQDEEGSSPLHVAARMLHYSTIDLMINWCPDSFELRDNKGRNFLHIVAQLRGGRIISYVQDAQHAMVSWPSNLCYRLGLKKLNKTGKRINLDHHGLEKIVNERDNEGSTPLHCASMNGSSAMIWELLQVNKADTTVINNEGKTALDYSILLDNVFAMAHITATLFTYGATFGPQRQDKLKNWKDKVIIDKTSKNLIIVSVLIATIALSAAFNVPGSYNSDGVSNLRLEKQYNLFIVFDTLAMSASVSVVMLLVVAKTVSGKHSRICFTLSLILLWISLSTMELAFVLAVSATLGDGKYPTKTFVYFIPTVFFFCTVFIISFLCTVFWKALKFISLMKKKTQTKRQIDIQCPALTTYIRISYLFIISNNILCLIVMGFIVIFPQQ